MIPLRPVVIGSIALVTITEILLDKYATPIESFLETHKITKAKSISRFLYNVHFRFSALLVKLYQSLVNFKSGLKGSYGGKIDHMFVYPIKSATKGLKVAEWEIDAFGLKYDREYSFAVFNEESKKYVPLTLKDSAKLSLIDVEFDKENQQFKFSYPSASSKTGTDFFTLPCTVTPEYLEKYSSFGFAEKTILLWAVEFEGSVIDKLLTPDFLQAVGLPEKTVLLYSTGGKLCTMGTPKHVKRNTLFQDYYPLLLCSQESFDYVKNQAGEAGDYVRMQSFRPNIIITDVKRPFIEDLYYKMDILSAETGARYNFTSTLKCIRCSVPNSKLDDGAMDKSGTISKTMSKYRRVDETNPHSSCFGMYLVNHQQDFTIRKGDTVDLLLKRSTKMEYDPFS